MSAFLYSLSIAIRFLTLEDFLDGDGSKKKKIKPSPVQVCKAIFRQTQLWRHVLFDEAQHRRESIHSIIMSEKQSE